MPRRLLKTFTFSPRPLSGQPWDMFWMPMDGWISHGKISAYTQYTAMSQDGQAGGIQQGCTNSRELTGLSQGQLELWRCVQGFHLLRLAMQWEMVGTQTSHKIYIILKNEITPYFNRGQSFWATLEYFWALNGKERFLLNLQQSQLVYPRGSPSKSSSWGQNTSRTAWTTAPWRQPLPGHNMATWLYPWSHPQFSRENVPEKTSHQFPSIPIQIRKIPEIWHQKSLWNPHNIHKSWYFRPQWRCWRGRASGSPPPRPPSRPGRCRGNPQRPRGPRCPSPRPTRSRNPHSSGFFWTWWTWEDLGKLRKWIQMWMKPMGIFQCESHKISGKGHQGHHHPQGQQLNQEGHLCDFGFQSLKGLVTGGIAGGTDGKDQQMVRFDGQIWFSDDHRELFFSGESCVGFCHWLAQ